MIKVATLGMLDIAKINPTIKSTNDVKNYQFLTDDGDVYLISNTLTGDNAYVDDVTIKAGEYLNGYLVKAWDGQNLIVDEKHITYASNKSYADIVKGTTIMTIGSDGKLAAATSAPASGVYFKVVDKCKLTEKAIKVKVIVVDKDTVSA